MKKLYLVTKTIEYSTYIEGTSEDDVYSQIQDPYVYRSYSYNGATIDIGEAYIIGEENLSYGEQVIKFCKKCDLPFYYQKSIAHRAVHCPDHRRANQYTT